MPKIGAVIVLYYPVIEHVNNMLLNLCDNVEHVVLVDNSAAESSFLGWQNVHYIHLGSNLGIATAQNTGLKKLIEFSCDAAFLFDQDSTIQDDFIQNMVRMFFASNDNRLTAIGPQIICNYNGKKEKARLQKPYKNTDGFKYVKQIISSGMLIDLTKLSLIGMKEDELFIDGVDHEWCWRAAKLNYSVAIASNIEMTHQMGIERKRILGVSYKVGHAIRHYYQVRNILLLVRRPYVPVYWKFRSSIMIIIRLTLVILQGENKASRLKYILLGFMDGLIGKKGKLASKKKPV